MPTQTNPPFHNRGTLSLELLAAQQRLAQQRAAYHSEQRRVDVTATRHETIKVVSYQKLLCSLPPHLGWGSNTLRRNSHTAWPKQETHLSPLPYPPSVTPTKSALSLTKAPSIAVYPDLATAFLREKVVAAGRIWVLLRFLDRTGRGWFCTDDVKTILTEKDAAHRVCGWRQLRNLLHQGEGTFWRRNNGRLWLTSLAKLLLKFDIARLNYNPVAIPLSVWQGNIGALRAHLYASFHSGRATDQPKCDPSPPIARATLASITSVSPRIQRRYEQIADVEQQHNYCIGEHFSEDQYKEAAWQYGQAAFPFVDILGKRGRCGQKYIARQLPNTYAGPHHKQKTYQRKRINKRLADLLNSGTAGNGRSNKSSDADGRFELRYFANGRLAAKAVTHNRTSTAYWHQPSNQRGSRFWHSIETG